MGSHLHARATTALVLGTLVAAVFACSRSASNETSTSRWSFGKAQNHDAWEVKCDALCELKAKAPTLDALCKATLDAAAPTLGETTCEARKSVGFPAIESAVSDAAILELATAGKAEKQAFLAVKTATGWQLARPLGSAQSFRAIDAVPVDVPGIEPAGVEVRVALTDAKGTSERLFVCGLSGDGATKCPVAVEVASNKSTISTIGTQVGAGLSDAMRGSAWRAEVELTPTGYVAKKVTGTLPDGLAGEHGFSAR